MGYIFQSTTAEDDALKLEVGTVLRRIARGEYPEQLGDRQTTFHVLGLSPNASRLSVRFWHVSSVGDFIEHLGMHYRIYRSPAASTATPNSPPPGRFWPKRPANRKTFTRSCPARSCGPSSPARRTPTCCFRPSCAAFAPIDSYVTSAPLSSKRA